LGAVDGRELMSWLAWEVAFYVDCPGPFLLSSFTRVIGSVVSEEAMWHGSHSIASEVRLWFRPWLLNFYWGCMILEFNHSEPPFSEPLK